MKRKREKSPTRLTSANAFFFHKLKLQTTQEGSSLIETCSSLKNCTNNTKNDLIEVQDLPKKHDGHATF